MQGRFRRFMEILNARPLRVIRFGQVATAAFLGFLVFSMAGMYRNFREVDRRAAEISGLMDRLDYLDEALTMSAHMLAATGDAAWHRRYRALAPELDSVAAGVMRVGVAAGQGEAAARVRTASDSLMAMEEQAFRRVRQGDRASASAVLAGPAYAAQKRTYTAATRDIGAALREQIRAGKRAFERRMIVAAATTLATALVLVLIGSFVHAVLRRYLASREQALAAVRASEERYRLTGRVTREAIWDWTMATGEVVWGDGLRATFGYPAEQVRPDMGWWSELIHPDDLSRVMAGIEAVTEGSEDAWSDEYRFRRGDGSYAEVLDRGLVIRDEHGSPVRMIGSVADVTDSRAARREILDSRAEMRALINAMSDVILVLDAEGRYLKIAETASPALYRPPAELVGRTMHEVLPREAADFFLDHVRRALHLGVPQSIEYSLPIGERPVWFSGAISPMGPDRVVWVARDITARKQVEEELVRAKEAAEAANRAKSDFLASMSHELRTPLNSVIGFSSVLRKNKAGNLREQDLTYLARIHSNGTHLLELINAVLDLSKIEAGKMELDMAPVALDQLVHDTLDQVKGAVRGRDVELRAAIPERVAPLLTDAGKLRQVLINLVGNAIKFTERGSVTVALFTDGESGVPVRIDVRDTGIGIPPERLTAIFQPFEQAESGTSRHYGGTGLGLAISRSLAEALGYRLEVASTGAGGSTFSIVFAPEGAPGSPAAVSPVAVPAGEARAAEPPAGDALGSLANKLVLVIDDEADARMLLTHHLDELGCQTIAASSGPQGLRMAREFRPDLITLDLLLPDTTGWEILRTLKADPDLCHIPVVIVSVVAGENRASVLGAVDVLDKPIERNALLAVLQRHLEPAETRRVLVVDDDADARDMLSGYLREDGVEIRTAASGAEALRVLQGFTPHLIVLDLLMPRMDGVAVLKALYDAPGYRDIPVVLVTAKDLSPYETDSLGQLAVAVLRKDAELEEDLAAVIRQIHSGPASRAKTTPTAD